MSWLEDKYFDKEYEEDYGYELENGVFVYGKIKGLYEVTWYSPATYDDPEEYEDELVEWELEDVGVDEDSENNGYQLTKEDMSKFEDYMICKMNQKGIVL